MISQVLLVMNNDHFHFSSCVNTHPAIILIRYCELLYFANIPFFDDSTKHFLKKHNKCLSSLQQTCTHVGYFVAR